MKSDEETFEKTNVADTGAGNSPEVKKFGRIQNAFFSTLLTDLGVILYLRGTFLFGNKIAHPAGFIYLFEVTIRTLIWKSIDDLQY